MVPVPALVSHAWSFGPGQLLLEMIWDPTSLAEIQVWPKGVPVNSRDIGIAQEIPRGLELCTRDGDKGQGDSLLCRNGPWPAITL